MLFNSTRMFQNEKSGTFEDESDPSYVHRQVITVREKQFQVMERLH